MPIEIINDANTTLIDDNYANLILVSTGTFMPARESGQGYAGGLATVTYTALEGEYPLIAVESQAAFCMQSVSISGNTYTFRIVFDTAGVGVAQRYYIFSLPTVVPDAKGLIQTRDANGRLVFDSSLDYMRAVYFSAVSTPGNVVTLPTGRRYAAVCMKPMAAYAELPINMPTDWVLETSYRGFRVINNVVSIYEFIYRSVGATFPANPVHVPSAWSFMEGALMVIDVTNML